MNGRLSAALAVAVVGVFTLSQGGVALAQSDEFECEFPAQAIKLTRNVNITNAAPQLTEVETDVCGNVLSYTETMRPTLDASQWMNVSPWTQVPSGSLELGQPGVLVNTLDKPDFQPQLVDDVCFSCTDNEASE